MNALKGWRTLLFNGATLALLVVTGLSGSIENPETIRWLAIAVVVINAVLRWVTTGPVAPKT